MPELPEVETSCNGIRPFILNQKITQVIIRQAKLRWPIPHDLAEKIQDQKIIKVTRRAKYLLLSIADGTLILHLGMSGSLRILEKDSKPDKHDHFELVFAKNCLRFRDPRRFGAVLWADGDPLTHSLLKNLGVEPLTNDFDANYLYQQARARKVPIKTLLMDSKVVVGIGNIYACETLFKAKISPKRACNKISKKRIQNLTEAIKNILTKAIAQGGTTLKDFRQQDGQAGYFSQQLNVYGRTGLPCVRCQKPIKKIVMSQRSTFYCGCQR